MRYLTEIRDKDGHSSHFLFVRADSIGKYSFTAYDPETQKTVDINIRSNCLGITTSIERDEYEGEYAEFVVAAIHNKNTAELHRFFEFVDTQPINYTHDGSDICFETHRDDNEVSNTSTLTVILGEFTRVLGVQGSVVIRMLDAYVRKDGEENRAYTLYDFLLNLCSVCMLNVMSYETIRLVGGHAIMTIKLAHSTEAERFFNEMYERAWGNSFSWYVSDIHVDGDRADYAIWPCASNLVVTIKNIDTGETKKVSDFPIDDCYGFCPRLYNGDYLILCHTARAARLYKYIKLAKTYLTLPERNSDADVCYWGERADFETPQDAATRTLSITLMGTDTLVGLYDPCGSVVCVEDVYQTFVKYQSLYDFLISVCSSTRLRIMAYRTVRIECRLGSTEIVFDHGEEADWFLKRMYVFR